MRERYRKLHDVRMPDGQVGRDGGRATPPIQRVYTGMYVEDLQERDGTRRLRENRGATSE